MQALAEIVLSNAAIATGMALLAAAVGRYCRVPTVTHAMWLLVLLKLVTPPILRVPVPLLPSGSSQESIAQPSFNQDSQPATLASDTSLGSPFLSFDQEPVTAQLPAISVMQSAGQTAMPKNRAGEAHPASEPPHLLSSQLANLQIHNDSVARIPVPWSVLVLFIWGLGSAAWFAVALLRLVRFRREIDRPWPDQPALQQRADELAQRMRLRRAPAVKLVNGAIPPMLWAMCRPARIVLPASLVAILTPHQTDALLVHELAHYRRRDHWVRWFELLVLGLYWWHPVAWIARRQLHRAEEQCCDAWVLRTLPNQACDYARAILQTIDFLATDPRPAPLLATGLSPAHQLERRIEMILHARPLHRLHVCAQWSLFIVGLLLLPLTAVAQVAVPGEAAAPAVEARPAATPSAAAPALAPAAASEDIAGEPAHTLTVTAEPSVQAVLDSGVERRLQRLEKMVESILVEMKTQSGATPRFRNSAVTSSAPSLRPGLARSSAVTGFRDRSDSPTLADLKKMRIDLEEQLENLQADLSKIDEQISKLQSARSGDRDYPARIK